MWRGNDDEAVPLSVLTASTSVMAVERQPSATTIEPGYQRHDDTQVLWRYCYRVLPRFESRRQIISCQGDRSREGPLTIARQFHWRDWPRSVTRVPRGTPEPVPPVGCNRTGSSIPTGCRLARAIEPGVGNAWLLSGVPPGRTAACRSRLLPCPTGTRSSSAMRSSCPVATPASISTGCYGSQRSSPAFGSRNVSTAGG